MPNITRCDYACAKSGGAYSGNASTTDRCYCHYHSRSRIQSSPDPGRLYCSKHDPHSTICYRA
jgi:hypothetical protein